MLAQNYRLPPTTYIHGANPQIMAMCYHSIPPVWVKKSSPAVIPLRNFRGNIPLIPPVTILSQRVREGVQSGSKGVQ